MALEWLHWLRCLKRKNLPHNFSFPRPLYIFMGTSERIGATSHDALSKLSSSALLGKSGNLVLPNHQLDPFSTKHSPFFLVGAHIKQYIYLRWCTNQICNLWSLTCPRINALCHAWGAVDNGERELRACCVTREWATDILGLVKHAGTLKRYLLVQWPGLHHCHIHSLQLGLCSLLYTLLQIQ